jgi:uncharacterized protein YueI
MDYKNGTYELKMCPRVAYQNFSVHIKLGDQDIHGSPFTVTSEPGITTDVQMVKIENNRVGERCTFEFVAKDTIGNEKVGLITSHSGAWQVTNTVLNS